MIARIHAFEAVSRANGPGRRAVVWFQGCGLGCPGCFNPGTHARDGGQAIATSELAARILAAAPRVEGVTFSGGEPLEQPLALLEVLRALRAPTLTRLLFSGYTLAEMRRMPQGPAILDHLDVLVAGRYVASRPAGRSLLGSSNQQVHFITDRYGPEDIARVPPRELILRADGSVTASGIDPWAPPATGRQHEDKKEPQITPTTQIQEKRKTRHDVSSLPLFPSVRFFNRR